MLTISQSGKDADNSSVAGSPAVNAAPALPTVGEAEEPAEPLSPVATPSNAPPTEIPAATPKTNKKSSGFLSYFSRTPKNKTPIAPTGLEMHPHHHQTSTAKPLDEARWLGFSAMGPHTEPVKKGTNKVPVTQVTPTKAQEVEETKPLSTPEFKFRFRRQSLELSPEAKREQMRANPDEFGIKTGEDARKIAKPKGKAGRFSDVHMREFKKMDSIANSPYARARAVRDKAAAEELKRTQPKAEEDKPAKSLKRSPSKADLDSQDGKPASRLPRTKSSVSLNKPAESSKRTKHTREDDASTARPVSREGGVPATPSSNIGLHRSNTRIPRGLSHLHTPTKASLARSQSVKTLKKTTMIPTLGRSPSVQNLGTPTKPRTPATSLMDGMRKTSQTLSRLPTMKSILRTPIRHYSDDPAKIAAGTHIATPPGLSNLEKSFPDVPATEPAQKRVEFTASTLARMEKDRSQSGQAPSPTKEQASPEVPVQTSGAVTYPTLGSEVPVQTSAAVTYPTLPFGSTSPTRRTTVDGAAGDFTFRSDQSIKFGSAMAKPTIRQVRTSDVTDSMPNPFTGSPKKRKMGFADTIAEEEKENNSEEEEGRPAKKQRYAPSTPAKKTPVSRIATGQRGKRQSALSQARLNLLAQPKNKRG
ncbi:hypothetical protein K490DRAFT_32009 [Saccharata proteae CBS 121410]|uniref:Erythromycin esterase n=1 Tax=Saccharata proteae CBS 121410 TaxID=1314787 RepID=A0A9P4M3P0_9PEZI|nr:hypothetical protein K490DRAFT_32009 [Saccharata proteae CBS 121410]